MVIGDRCGASYDAMSNQHKKAECALLLVKFCHKSFFGVFKFCVGIIFGIMIYRPKKDSLTSPTLLESVVTS